MKLPFIVFFLLVVLILYVYTLCLLHTATLGSFGTRCSWSSRKVSANIIASYNSFSGLSCFFFLSLKRNRVRQFWQVIISNRSDDRLCHLTTFEMLCNVIGSLVSAVTSSVETDEFLLRIEIFIW